MSSTVAAGGIFVLAMLAPFEMASPVLRLPGQSLTNLEAALVVACAAWAAAVAWSAERPRLRAPLVGTWALFVVAMAIAAVTASAQRNNASHMVGRFMAAGAVYTLAVQGLTTSRRVRLAIAASIASGVVVAILAILEYVQVQPVIWALRAFRPSVTAVGAQVRAGGSLQYPTIASMYLEVVFALGLGMLITSIDDGARRWAIWFAAMVLIGEAITLTFTRAGLITMATSLVFAALWCWRDRGIDRGIATVVTLAGAIALLFVVSRPAQSLWLRMTSEGQDTWYRARIDAPPTVSLNANAAQYVPLRVTNVGRVAWDSSAAPPIVFSYHWLDAAGDRVVAWEGERTSFANAVLPGQTVSVFQLVRAPREPGRYQIEWDLAEEGRLWFSTEQEAPDPVLTSATVTGQGTGVPIVTKPRPLRTVRPGRMVLWRTALRMVAAHPLLGVGPDNFRLLYGSYAGLPGADPRTHTNNMYLEVLVGGGAVAFAVFAWFSWHAYALFAAGAPGTRRGARHPRDPSDPIWVGVAAAGIAIALHGLVDSFLSFAPTYTLFALTLGFAAAVARGEETPADAHRV